MRRALVVVPAMVAFALLGWALFTARPNAEIGRPAPAFALPDLRRPALERSLADFRGRPVVVNFWASWCDPCREEAPELVRVAKAYEGRVAFLGVSILDGREEALGYEREFGLPYPSVRDASGRVSKRYQVTGVPETIFVDAAGRLVGKFVGALTPGKLEAIVEDLLALRSGDVLTITGRGRTRPVP